jgi:Raf kinase inhibitor-like YbhB/YbcL family protein
MRAGLREDAALFSAIFDCYEYNLRQELGEDRAGVTNLRGELLWVDMDHMTQGFGERFPIENASQDNYRSQSNRRVEVMMFDPGEEPDLVASAANPDAAEVYMPGIYQQHPVPMSTGTLQYAWVREIPIIETYDVDEVDAAIFEPPPVDPDAPLPLDSSTVVGGIFPDRCASASGNVSPALRWSSSVDGVAEHLIVMRDLDAEDMLHWVVSGIPASTQELPEDVRFGTSSDVAIQSGVVGDSRMGYQGPSPPAGESHVYVIEVFALRESVGVLPATNTYDSITALLSERRIRVHALPVCFPAPAE